MPKWLTNWLNQFDSRDDALAALRATEEDPRPDHPWNDPDGDGHNCVGCSPDSIWKCDWAAHNERTDA